MLSIGADAQVRSERRVGGLLLAALTGKQDLTALLLKAGADVNASIIVGTDEEIGATPLMIAAREGYMPIVLALLESGADVQARTQAGYTAVRLAKENGHAEIVQVLQSTYQARMDEKNRAVDLGL